MTVMAREPRANAAFLRLPRSGNHHDLGLFGVGAQPTRPRGGLGLYHLAWQVDTIEELEQARLTLVDLDAYTGESSHGATKSVYGQDPDGNEFEVMWMLPRAQWGDFENAAPIDRLDLPGEVRRWGGVRTAAELVRGGRVMTAETFAPPVVATYGSTDPTAPLVVLLHGRGSDEARDPRPGRAPAGRAGVRRRPRTDRRGRRLRVVRQPWHRPSGRRARCAAPWTGSAAGSTTSPPRADRCSWSASAAALPSPAAWSSTTPRGTPARPFSTAPCRSTPASPPAPAGWRTCPSSSPRATTTTSSRATCWTGPGPTCCPSPARPPSRSDSPAATSSPHGGPRPGRVDRPSPRAPRAPRRHPAGPPAQVVWPTLPAGELAARVGPRPEVSWTIPQQQESQNAPPHCRSSSSTRSVPFPGWRWDRRASRCLAPAASPCVRARGRPGLPRAPGRGVRPPAPGVRRLPAPGPAHGAGRRCLEQGLGTTPHVGRRLSPGFMMVYGPRDEDELVTVRGIVAASHAYATAA